MPCSSGLSRLFLPVSFFCVFLLVLCLNMPCTMTPVALVKTHCKAAHVMLAKLLYGYLKEGLSTTILTRWAT